MGPPSPPSPKKEKNKKNNLLTKQYLLKNEFDFNTCCYIPLKCTFHLIFFYLFFSRFSFFIFPNQCLLRFRANHFFFSSKLLFVQIIFEQVIFEQVIFRASRVRASHIRASHFRASQGDPLPSKGHLPQVQVQFGISEIISCSFNPIKLKFEV